jgi:hypothetical protein
MDFKILNNQQAAERVFISYSHDNEKHKSQVFDFASRLREDGIDAIIDQFEEAPELGWPRWMERQIRDADYVVVVGSKLYHDRLLGDEDDGVGLGAKWEGAILYQHLYESDMKTKGFIPIIFHQADAEFIPMPLRPFTRYLIDGEQGYEKIYRRITNQPKARMPQLGKRRELPKVKGGGTLYFGGPIDPELWDVAKWRATFFVTGKDTSDAVIPSLGLGFRDRVSAEKIFAGWKQRYGEDDLDEELRVSIIEGDIPGEESGYTVHIGSDLETTYKKLSRKPKFEDDDVMMLTSRLNRMNPPPNSQNLDRFKQAVRQSKVFKIVWGIVSEDRQDIVEFGEIEIRKSRIYFRHIDEIGPNDPDVIVLKTGVIDRGDAD